MNAPKDLIILDCRGMQCPAPILQLARTARQHKNAPVVLEVQADDHDFPIDVRAWCRTAQATILKEDNQGDAFRVWLGLNGANLPAGFGLPEPEEQPEQSQPSPLQMLDDEPNVPTFTESPAAPEPASHLFESDPFESEMPTAVAPAQPAAHRPAPLPSDERLDLRGEPVSAALLALSARLLESPQGVTVLVDGEAIGSIYTWANATRSTVSQIGQQDGANALLIKASSEVKARPAVQQAPQIPTALPAAAPAQLPATTSQENCCTLLVLHNDFEALMAALMVANAAAAQSMSVEIYFSFWGINLLRADEPGTGEKKPPFLQRMMAWMMPAGPKRQTLGKMNFGGMGTGMMTHLMRKGNILSLTELMDAAEEQGVKFVGCTMSMGLMGIRRCDLTKRENLSFGGATAFVEAAQRSKMSMVF